MRAPTERSGELEQPRWLRPLLVWSTVLSGLLSTLEVGGRLVSHHPSSPLVAVVLGSFLVAEVAALLALRERRVGLAAGIFAWALLAITLAATPLTTFITPALMLMPLFAIAVAQPFLRGAALRALLLGVGVAELLTTAYAARFLPAVGPVPSTLARVLFVVSTTVVALLIGFLLGQFSRQVRQSLELARATASVRENFLSIASHELQTPLTVLKLHVQSLQRSAARDGQPPQPALRTTDAQITKLSRLVENMLDLSRLQAGRLRLELAPTRLDELVHRVVAELVPLAERSGSTVQVAATQTVVGTWDALRLEQVVGNLLSNAIKYGEGKPIHLTCAQDGDVALVTVRDEGPGIHPDDLRRLFLRFERGEHTRAQGGVGLGLYIAQELAGAMGGAISVASQANQGAVFTLRLPLAPPRA